MYSCILVVRGSLINMGFFLQAKVSVLGAKLAAPSSLGAAASLLSQVTRQYPEAVALTSFFAIFGVVIALMKDVPDVRGDVEYKIPSFSVKLGAARMFRYCMLSCVLNAYKCSCFVCVYQGIRALITEFNPYCISPTTPLSYQHTWVSYNFLFIVSKY